MKKGVNYAVALVLIIPALIFIIYVFTAPTVLQEVAGGKTEQEIKDSIYREQVVKDSIEKEKQKIKDTILKK